MSRKILVWFRNDLRLHDNEMLAEAVSRADEILPVYIFDPRYFEKTKFNTYKTGLNRTYFLIQSVTRLKKSLNGKLLVAQGLPKDILPALVEKHQITEVYHHREVAYEETTISSNVEDALWKLKVNLKHFVGHTLYNKEDLPFPIKDIPDDFLKFKKKIEREAIVKPCFNTPTKINIISVENWGEIPTAQKLLNTAEKIDKLEFEGGEQKAIHYLNKYLSNLDQNKSLKKHEIISKLSPWIAMGCLSPRLVYWKIKEAENKIGIHLSFQQIIIGLLWRDYYRFMLKKYNNSSIIPLPKNILTFESNSIEQEQFELWKNAKTENPIINQFIKLLRKKGYIPFKERQLIGSYLINKLKVSWILGAALFEETLIDYCPASNWGNWINLTEKSFNKKTISETDFNKLIKLLSPKDTRTELV